MSTHATTRMQDAIPRPTPARPNILGWLAIAAGGLLMAVLIYSSFGHDGAEHVKHHEPPPWWGLGILPFVGLLGCIAVLPLLRQTHHWWENNLNRFGVSMGFAALTLAYYIAIRGFGSIALVLEHAVIVEYIPFIVLLFALYVISGGISLRGDLVARPSTNLAFLAIGAAIASFIGTTGASMLLIRPLLQTNSERRYVTHTVVFFIFLVSNIGGCLLPIGDPPLFLGYLFGVPFFWTLGLWGPWLVTCGILLLVYFAVDRYFYKKEEVSDIQRDLLERTPLRLTGWNNILLLAGVVACVAFIDPNKPLPGTSFTPFPFMRELCMLALVGVSLLRTPKGVREFNQFNYTAILEVAALFIGIFIAMQVPVEYLAARGAELGVNSPWEFFWATGSLSSFLDNAPTYVVFFETAKAVPVPEGAAMVGLGGGGAIVEPLLVAISLGAVFMGAMTYIGNGPNFMVKSIAQQAGIRMPSFFGYMIKYSVPVLIPVFIVTTLLFLMPWSPLS